MTNSTNKKPLPPGIHDWKPGMPKPDLSRPKPSTTPGAVPRPTTRTQSSGYSLDNPADPWGQQLPPAVRKLTREQHKQNEANKTIQQQTTMQFGSPDQQVSSWGDPSKSLKPIPDAMFNDPNHPWWKSRTEAERLRGEFIEAENLRESGGLGPLEQFNPDPGMPESFDGIMPELDPNPKAYEQAPGRGASRTPGAYGTYTMGGQKYETDLRGEWKKVNPDGTHSNPYEGSLSGMVASAGPDGKLIYTKKPAPPK